MSHTIEILIQFKVQTGIGRENSASYSTGRELRQLLLTFRTMVTR